jgi:hypothetical protein
VATIYAGFLDIADTAPIDWGRINALGLFFEQIAVFDAFFLCRGKLWDALIEDNAVTTPSNERLVRLKLDQNAVIRSVQQRLLVPCLRTGKTLSDVWYNGSPYGFDPARFQAGDAMVGNKLFSEIRWNDAAFIPWNDAMRDATTCEFGQKVNEEWTRESIEEIANNLRRLRRRHGNFGLDREVGQSVDLIEAVLDQAKQNKSNPRYRRGIVEGLIGEYTGEQFSYAEIAKRKRSSLIHLTADRLLQTLSGVYHGYHAVQFGCDANAASATVDGLAFREYRAKSRARAYADIVIQLLPEVDFNKLELPDVFKIRTESVFAVTVDLVDKVLEFPSENSIGALADHCRGRLRPRIFELRRAARKSGQIISTVSQTAGAFIAAGDVLAQVVGYQLTLAVGQHPIIGAALGAHQSAAWTAASISTEVFGVGIWVGGNRWADDIAAWRKRRNAVDAMKRVMRKEDGPTTSGP